MTTRWCLRCAADRSVFIYTFHKQNPHVAMLYMKMICTLVGKRSAHVRFGGTQVARSYTVFFLWLWGERPHE